MADPTPIPPTPAPQPSGIRWDEFRDWAKSLWTCAVATRPKHVGGAVKGAARGLYSHSPNILSTGILAAALVFAVGAHGCTLPTLPPWPWFNPTPAPLTALEKSFADAYAADTAPDKAALVAKLATLTDSFVGSVRQSGQVKTTGDLFASWKSSVAANVSVGKIPHVDAAIAAYLDGKLPTVAATPMTDQLWLTAVSEFSTVAAALKKGAK